MWNPFKVTDSHLPLYLFAFFFVAIIVLVPMFFIHRSAIDVQRQALVATSREAPTAVGVRSLSKLGSPSDETVRVHTTHHSAEPVGTGPGADAPGFRDEMSIDDPEVSDDSMVWHRPPKGLHPVDGDLLEVSGPGVSPFRVRVKGVLDDPEGAVWMVAAGSKETEKLRSLLKTHPSQIRVKVLS